MSAPDDKPEGLTSTSGALAERASGPESDVVAMKRYSVCDYHLISPPVESEVNVVLASDADRVIATERRLNSEAIAARDARIAKLTERLQIADAQAREALLAASDALASRDAEIAVLKGDLNIARLQRDAKLCSECPRSDVLTAAQAEIGRLREALQVIAAQAVPSGRTDELIALIRKVQHKASTALAPPSQAPEARRDVGGEKL